MHIAVLNQGKVIVINIVGDFNIQEEKDIINLKRKFRELVYDEACRRIIQDVSGIRKIDSTGIGAIVALLNTVRKEGGDLRTAGTFCPEVREAIDLCGLFKVFTHYENVKEGIEKFSL